MASVLIKCTKVEDEIKLDLMMALEGVIKAITIYPILSKKMW